LEPTQARSGGAVTYLDPNLREYAPQWRVHPGGTWELVRVTEERAPGGPWVADVRTLCTMAVPA
jgi:hypothetical protein